MKCNFILIKLKDKNNANSNNNKILELFQLSAGNNIISLDYNKNKEESLNQNLDINYYKTYIKRNIGKMIYKNIKNKEIKIFNEKFLSNNRNRTKIIVNNKQYELKENIENIDNQLKFFNIKIKFLDHILRLNSMFSNCETLYSVHYFININTKNLKTIYGLFDGCHSLLFIDDISNWNINNINNISKIFYQCSLLKSLPNISKWNISNANDISELFSECSSLKELPDFSKWNISNVNNMSKLFYNCYKIKSLPDISNWNTISIKDIHEMFYGCSDLESLPDI